MAPPHDALFQPSEITPHLWGHDGILHHVMQHLKAGKLSHALLLCGPEGVGKACVAYHLARLLLQKDEERCWPLPADHPLWYRLSLGTHPDFFALTSSTEGTAPKNIMISIERVREAIHFLQWHSVEGTRVVLIDAIDHLNRSGMNALLKTLEEPRPQTFLVMVSHAPQRLPDTLKSRCTRIPCMPLTRQAIIHALRTTSLAPEDDDFYVTYSGGRLGWIENLHRHGGMSWVKAWPSPSSPAFREKILSWVEEAHKNQEFLTFLENWIVWWVHDHIHVHKISSKTLHKIAYEQEILTAFARMKELGLDVRQVLLYVLNRLTLLDTL